MDKFLTSFDNTQLYVNENIVDGSQIAIVILHGLAEHSGRYCDFINALNKANISTFACDLRGHGKSGTKLGDIESFNYLLEDVEVVFNYIIKNFNFKKVGVFGHSIGGLIASAYISKTGKFNFCVLSSPVCYLPKKLKVIKIVPYKLLKNVYVKKRVSESQEMLNVNRQDPLSLKKFSVRTVGEIFNFGVKFLNKNLNIQCPAMLVCGKQDVMLSETEQFKTFFNKLPNAQNKFIVYADAKHRIVQNQNADSHIADIISWIKNL